MRDVLLPHAQAQVPILGLEPSCLFTLKDEHLALLPGSDAETIAGRAMLLEDYMVAERKAARVPDGMFKALPQHRALVHGHCHQKAFGVFGAVTEALKLIPGLAVEPIESSCCGMAGAFGYEAEHLEVSLKMAEASLLPAVRKAGDDAIVVADGTSCRHQIADGAGREALHVARVLEQALA